MLSSRWSKWSCGGKKTKNTATEAACWMNPIKAPSLICILSKGKQEKKDQHCISSHPQTVTEKKVVWLIQGFGVCTHWRCQMAKHSLTLAARPVAPPPHTLSPIATSRQRRKLQLLHFSNCWDNSSTVGPRTPLSRCSDKMVRERQAFKVKDLSAPEHLLNDSFRWLYESAVGNWHFHINVSTGGNDTSMCWHAEGRELNAKCLHQCAAALQQQQRRRQWVRCRYLTVSRHFSSGCFC